MNFVVFNESDGNIEKDIPYICSEPYNNVYGYCPMVDVHVKNRILKVYIDDAGIQFFFHCSKKNYDKLFGRK